MKKASLFSDILSGIAADENNIIRTAIHFDELRPLTDEDLPQKIWYNTIPDSNPSPAAFYCYEDAGMTTGAFLASQSLRYIVTGESEAMRNAEKAFQGICFIYELGRVKQEGYFPKPYGGKISSQISRDQYIFVLNGLASYHRIADSRTKRQIEHIMCKMVDYWISIRYTDSYFGLPPQNQLLDFMGSLFLGLVRIPYGYSGKVKYLKEYERLCTNEKLAERMCETLRGRFMHGKTYDNAMYFRQTENPVMMKCMAVDSLWDTDIARRDLWQRSLQAFLDNDLLLHLDPDSGLNYYILKFDAAQNRTVLTPPGKIAELENPLNIPCLTWGGIRKTPGSSQTAYSAAVIADRLNNQELAATAFNILEKLELQKFRAYTVPDESHLPPDSKWKMNILHSCNLAYWLWTYWLGRERNLWTSGGIFEEEKRKIEIEEIQLV